MEFFFFAVGITLQWILEVAGAGGAIWGMSEVWKMRGFYAQPAQESNDRLRIASNIVFTIGTIRFLFRYAPDWGIKQALVDPHAWIADSCGASKKETQPQSLNENCGFEVAFFLVGVFMQWTLEVAGAGGAWWGMSEVWGARGYSHETPVESNDRLRYVSNTVFCIALIRMICHYFPDHPVNVAFVDPHNFSLAAGSLQSFQLECCMFLVGLFMQFTLEVAGAGGAWWGMSEVWGMRGYSKLERGMATNDNLRPVSNTVFAIACVRMLEKYMPQNDHHKAMLDPHQWALENLGCLGGGGDDEAVDTRRPESNQEMSM